MLLFACEGSVVGLIEGDDVIIPLPSADEASLAQMEELFEAGAYGCS